MILFILFCYIYLVLSEITQLRTKCRDLVTYFKKSVLASGTLTEIQKRLGVSQHKVIQEVETRWNSTYSMFERLIEQEQAITLTCKQLKEQHRLLTENEWELLHQLVSFLENFKTITDFMQQERNVSLSFIVPILYTLKNQYLIIDEDKDSELIQKVNVK